MLSFNKIHLKMLSVKWRPFCLCLNVLPHWGLVMHINISKLHQITSCRLVIAEPLPKPMLPYCQLEPYEQTSMNLNKGTNIFFEGHHAFRNVIWKWQPVCFGQYHIWPGDAIWLHKTGSALAQVVTCCMTALSRNLNQCCFIISKVQWHLSAEIIMRRSEDTNQ